MPVPHYLSKLAYNISEKKNMTSFMLKCGCGCTKFHVYQNYETAEERKLSKPYYDALSDLVTGGFSCSMTIDKDGTRHHWKTVFSKGIITKKEVFLPPKPTHCFCTILKIKCTECGTEQNLFDSRYNGYDGKFCEEVTQAEMDYMPAMRSMKFWGEDYAELKVTVENEPYDEFCENTGIDCSYEDYSEGFGWIIVHAISSSGKKRKILDLETG